MNASRRILLGLLMSLCSTPAFAHEGKTHVMGTVSALDAEHVIIKSREGKTVSVRLTPGTKYQKGESRAAASDLTVGDRAVIDVSGTKASLTATEIRFAPPHRNGEPGHPNEHRHSREE